MVAVLVMGVGAGCADPGPSVAPQVAPSLRAGEFAIPTISPPFGSTMDACPAALTTGVLIQLPDGALALQGPAETLRVRWPFGWRGASGPPVALVDEAGAVVATVGQTVEVGGGGVGAGWWLGCGGVTVFS
jgi:hypothetical protein